MQKNNSRNNSTGVHNLNETDSNMWNKNDVVSLVVEASLCMLCGFRAQGSRIRLRIVLRVHQAPHFPPQVIAQPWSLKI